VAEAKSKRRFYLRDENGDPVPGTVGLASRGSDLTVKADGVIDLDKLTAAQIDELERYAATSSHPVSEGEPED
jgi:hypothetical protein